MSRETDPVGESLLALDIIDRVALEDALAVQREGFPLASVIYLLGLAEEEPLVRVLSRRAGIPGVVLSRSILSVHNLHDIPEDIAKRYGILPIYRDRNHLFVAVGERLEPEVLNELSIISGRDVIPHVALHAVLARVIRQCYALLAAGEAYWFGQETSIQDLNDPQGLLTPVLDVDELPERIDAAPLDVTDPNLAVPVSNDDILEVHSGVEDDPEEESDALGMDLTGALPTARSVLLAISDERTADEIQAVLESEGHQVNRVSGGRAVIDALGEAPPDLLLLSVLLPQVHGYEICRRVKGAQRYAGLPVVLVSSAESPDRRDASLSERYHADAVLRSPVAPSALLGAVNRLLAHPPPTPPPGSADGAAARFDAAIAHYRAGRTEAAIKALEQAIAWDPFSPRCHFVLANILQHENRIYEAIAAYERTIELRPDYFPALTRLAYLQYRQGFLPRALRTWRRALATCTDADQRRRIAAAVDSLERAVAARRADDTPAVDEGPPQAPSPAPIDSP